MMLTRHPLSLARKGLNLLLLAGIFMLGAWSANAGEVINVPVHNAELVRLDRDASVVLIANPVIANVAVESERLIFVIGLEVGETNLYILDAEGKEILTAAVVVVPILDRRVTVDRANKNETVALSCSPRCVYVAPPAGTGAAALRTGSGAFGVGTPTNPNSGNFGLIGPGKKGASSAQQTGVGEQSGATGGAAPPASTAAAGGEGTTTTGDSGG